MIESAVFKRVTSWLDEAGYRFFVHIPSAHGCGGSYGEIQRQYRTHNIRISGYRPDILGFSPANHVFAVEVKGEKSLRKGFGQSVSYQRGVDHAYLAADATALQGLEELFLSKGIGIIAVGDTVSVTHPIGVDLKDRLYDTRNQLETLLTRTDTGSIYLPKYADPLNNLMPILAVSSHDCHSRSAIRDICEEYEYPFRSASERMVNLATSLGSYGNVRADYS